MHYNQNSFEPISVYCNFSLIHSTQTSSVAKSTPIQLVMGPLSYEVKQQRCEVGQSPLSNAEVKNGGAIPPLPMSS
jgi:hypothetical protein